MLPYSSSSLSFLVIPNQFDHCHPLNLVNHRSEYWKWPPPFIANACLRPHYTSFLPSWSSLKHFICDVCNKTTSPCTEPPFFINANSKSYLSDRNLRLSRFLSLTSSRVLLHSDCPGQSVSLFGLRVMYEYVCSGLKWLSTNIPASL
jgi:hypothetical protein